jgi:flagellar motor switch protein FliM
MKPRSETLSQAEIEALLATLPAEQGGAPVSAAPTPFTSRPVRTWDFRKPDKFSKDHMRSLLALHQSFARLASTAISARLRVGVTFRVTSVDQGLYEEYIELLPSQSVVNVVSLKPLEGNILFELQPELALVMLDRLLGGHGAAVDPRHEFTDIEMALIRNMGRTLLESLREAWVNLADVDPIIEDISASPNLVQVTSPTDIVVIVLLEVQVGDKLGTISLCVPHLVLEPLMQRLSAQVWVVSDRRRNATPEMRAQILGGLRKADLKVTAVLGETEVTVDDLLKLQEGDVLLIGHGSVSSARIRVGDQMKFSGVPGLVGGRVGVKITDIEGDEHVDE